MHMMNTYTAYTVRIIITIFLILANLSYAPAEDSISKEYLLKAAFIYNFARFTDWPRESFSGTDDPLVLLILGKDPFEKAIESIAGRKVQGRTLRIKRITQPEEIDRCHMLFISTSERDRLTEILQKINNMPVLTVGEMEGYTVAGGIINFSVEKNKIRFEINIDAAQRSGLKISSKLLRLAKIIRQENRDGVNR